MIKCYVLTMLITKTFITILSNGKGIDGKRWLVHGEGQDSDSCGPMESPCGTVNHAYKLSSSNDTILISGEDQKYEYDICGEDNVPLIIRKPISIQGILGTPIITCTDDRFGFIIQCNNTMANVSFSNLFISQVGGKLNNYCKPSSRGAMALIRGTVSLSAVSFGKVCTGVLIANTDQSTVVLLIDHVTFENVQFSIYTSKSSGAFVSLKNSILSGLSGERLPSYGVALTTYGLLDLNISNSYFVNFTEGVSVSSVSSIINIAIDNVTWTGNKGQSIIITLRNNQKPLSSRIEIHFCHFLYNIGDYSSSVHLISENADDNRALLTVTVISDSTFIGNSATSFFGTIYAEGVDLRIYNCTFLDNSVGREIIGEGSTQGFGGAIFVEHGTRTLVKDSVFINNTCSGFGGTIFARGKFDAFNCEFQGMKDTAIHPLLGDIIYATGGLLLVNTTWTLKDQKHNRAVIWHPGSPTVETWTIVLKGYFRAQCPIGSNISHHGILRTELSPTDRVSLSCKSCEREKYGLRSGFLQVIQNGTHVDYYYQRNVTCLQCRYGGLCEKGVIKAKSNYYGYTHGEPREVSFLSCPQGYCCMGSACRSYNSCAENRESTLCGKCVEGMSENLFNAKCTAIEFCDDSWFWLLYFPLGFCYIIFFMYIDKVGQIIKTQIVWWEDKMHIGHQDHDFEIIEEDLETSTLGMTDDFDESRDSLVGQSYLNITKVSRSLSELDTNKHTDVFNDVVSATFYFYQMVLLIKEHENQALHWILENVKSAFASLFTLSIESNNVLSVCPVKGMGPLTKLLLMKSFSMYLLVLLLFLNTGIVAVQKTFLYYYSSYTMERGGPPLTYIKVRLQVATIQILLLVYATLTNLAMSLVNCVPMSNHRVLFIDGEIVCFAWWQIMSLIIICLWVIPFPFSLYYSTVDLKGGNIEYSQFAFFLAFPLLYVSHRIFRTAKSRQRTRSMAQREDIMTAKRARKNVQNITIEKILNKLESPFRDVYKKQSTSHHVDLSSSTLTSFPHEREPVFWQGVMIIKRLSLIMIFTFINNPMTRLYLALFICLLFLIHHVTHQPYVMKIANYTETLCSACLVLFCSMSLLYAYGYVTDISMADDEHGTSFVFDWIEAAVLVLIPAFAVFVLGVLLATRVFVVLLRFIKNSCKYAIE